MTPVDAAGEADVWVPVRDEGYMCAACRLQESRLTCDDDYEAFRLRWNDPIKRLTAAEHQAFIDARLREDDKSARQWTWPTEDHVTDRAQRAAALAKERDWSEYRVSVSKERGVLLPQYKYGFPVGESYIAAVLENPDDDAPRWAYARWLRTFETSTALAVAEFIECQLRLAESFRSDPRADIKEQLPVRAFEPRQQTPVHLPDQPWWRGPGDACDRGPIESMIVLAEQGLIDRPEFYRGFVEHVAMKAGRFLEIADELYSLAPIRYLTLTYCKGLDHKDTGLLKALLDSPHLDRIRSLKFPVRRFGSDNEYTELNRLVDADLELLASSTHLRGLACLDLEDETHLNIRAFDALAASKNLPALSAVLHDVNRYGRAATLSFGSLGKQTRELADRPLGRYARELEARHGRVEWLHVAENYGSEAPDIEAIVEHPISPRKS